MTGWPFLDHPRPIAFAHRGGAGDWPENTWPAFEHAYRLGFRYLETDAHVTADGMVVAFHDDVLDRVTDRSGEIARLPWAEVRAAVVGGSERVVLLEELIDAFPDARFNIDPKHDEVVEPLVRVIQRTGSIDRVCCGAFSDRRLGELRRRLGPRLCTSGGPRATTALRAASYGSPARLPPIGCVQVPPTYRGRALVDERFVDAAHARGLQVHVWTIDDPDEMHRLLDMRVDGLMTDLPQVLKQVLVERSAWSGT